MKYKLKRSGPYDLYLKVKRFCGPLESRMKKGTRVIAKLGLAAASLLLVLGLLEIGFRLWAYWEDRKLLHSAMASRQDVPLKGTMNLRDLIQLHPNPRIIYDLRPGLEGIFLGQPVSTNEHGFRGRGHPVEKPPGTVRILGLGDSIMFGYGVKDDELYLARLEERLNRECPQRKWEVINTGVPGYNTPIEVETLKVKGLRFQPDIVVIEFVGNDLHLPNFIRREREYLSLNRSFLVDFLSAKSGAKDTFDILEQSPRHEGDNLLRFEFDPELVPAEYRDMVGVKAYKVAMTELRDLSEQHGFKVLVFFLREYRKGILKICRNLGFTTTNAGEHILRYMREHNVDQYPFSRMTISDKDPHPSPITHGIVCDVLFETFLELGIARKPDE